MQASTGNLAARKDVKDKKTAPFQRRGQFDREEVTIGGAKARADAMETGTEWLRMYVSLARRCEGRFSRQLCELDLGRRCA